MRKWSLKVTYLLCGNPWGQLELKKMNYLIYTYTMISFVYRVASSLSMSHLFTSP